MDDFVDQVQLNIIATGYEGLKFFGKINGLVAARSKFDSVTVRQKKEREVARWRPLFQLISGADRVSPLAGSEVKTFGRRRANLQTICAKSATDHRAIRLIAVSS